jgi:hypothetical protein
LEQDDLGRSGGKCSTNEDYESSETVSVVEGGCHSECTVRRSASYEDARSMVARIPGSHWVTVERGGHIFIHNDEHALAEIAAFLTSSTDQRPM